LMTCMFAMELGARGGSGDETVAIPTTKSIRSSRQWLWKSRNPIPQPSRKLGTQCRELGSKVPNSKRDGNSGSRCTFVSNTHKLGPSPPPHESTRDTTVFQSGAEVREKKREGERIFEIVEESFSTLLTHFGNVYARGSRYIIILTTSGPTCRSVMRDMVPLPGWGRPRDATADAPAPDGRHHRDRRGTGTGHRPRPHRQFLPRDENGVLRISAANM
jgi:hypothetical protein